MIRLTIDIDRYSRDNLLILLPSIRIAYKRHLASKAVLHKYGLTLVGDKMEFTYHTDFFVKRQRAGKTRSSVGDILIAVRESQYIAHGPGCYSKRKEE
jgi:hypothetical protein